MPIPFVCNVGGVNKAQFVEAFVIQTKLGDRSTCELTCKAIDGGFSPAVGQPVEITVASKKLFGGTVNQVEREVIEAATTNDHYLMASQSTATDWTHALDRRLTAERSWANVNSGIIVQDLANTYLTDEGIILTFVSTGTLVEKFQVSYATVRAA